MFLSKKSGRGEVRNHSLLIDRRMHYQLIYRNSETNINNGDYGYLAKLGKKRNTDHDFRPPFKWAENNNYLIR